jgi:hypothetical protein
MAQEIQAQVGAAPLEQPWLEIVMPEIRHNLLPGKAKPAAWEVVKHETR